VPKCEIKVLWRKLRGEEFHNPYFSINVDRAIEMKVTELDSHKALTEIMNN
jgi:hypothetical protein